MGSADKAKSVGVAEPVAPGRYKRLVYCRKEELATLKAAADVRLGNIVPAGGNAVANPRNGKVGGWDFDEMQPRGVTGGMPPSEAGGVRFRGESGLHGKTASGAFEGVHSEK